MSTSGGYHEYIGEHSLNCLKRYSTKNNIKLQMWHVYIFIYKSKNIRKQKDTNCLMVKL